jgi:hypothetical protein
MAGIDKTEFRGTPEVVKAPRSGMKIAVSRTDSDAFLAQHPMLQGRFGHFFVDSVRVEGVSSPVFLAVRNPWEITPEDDGMKKTAIDFVQYANLLVLPEALREPVEIFRREQAEGVNYSLRTYNIDRVRRAGEEIQEFSFIATHFLLTSEYRPIRH